MTSDNPKAKDINADNPFDLLRESLEKETRNGSTEESKTDIIGTRKEEEKLLQNLDKRVGTRYLVEDGVAVIYDHLGAKILSKGILKNVAIGGILLEVQGIDPAKNSQVVIEFGGKGLKIPVIKCKLQWLAPIKGHPKGHMFAGFQFISLSPQIKKTLENYFEEIKKLAGRQS